MNCERFLEGLAARLDGESRPEDPALVQHAARCPSCSEIEAGLSAPWPRLSEALGRIQVPGSLALACAERLAREERALARRQWFRIAVPAAAAALVAAWLLPRLPHRHGLDDHGALIDFAVSRHLALEQRASGREPIVLDPDLLREGAEDVAILEGAELVAFYRDLFGGDVRIPPAIEAPFVQAAFRRVGHGGHPVSNLILALRDRTVSVYRLRRDQAVLKDLRLIDDGTTTGIRIERCRSCHVIAVTRGEMVFILVSRQGIEPMITLVRETL
jgi:hypothetical protein